jgi:hypothetical protein
LFSFSHQRSAIALASRYATESSPSDCAAASVACKKHFFFSPTSSSRLSRACLGKWRESGAGNGIPQARLSIDRVGREKFCFLAYRLGSVELLLQLVDRHLRCEGQFHRNDLGPQDAGAAARGCSHRGFAPPRQGRPGHDRAGIPGPVDALSQLKHSRDTPIFRLSAVSA